MLAQREARIRSTLPGAAAVVAFEYDAGLAAGREQPFMAAVIGSRDVMSLSGKPAFTTWFQLWPESPLWKAPSRVATKI
jgi:hypothetical protein